MTSRLEAYNGFFADGLKHGAAIRGLVVCVHPQQARYMYEELRDLATTRISYPAQRRVIYRSNALLEVEVTNTRAVAERLAHGREYTHLIIGPHVPEDAIEYLRTRLRSHTVPNVAKNVTYT